MPFNTSSNPNKFAINMIWLNRTLAPEQKLIFKENWSEGDVSNGSSRENYGELLNTALAWCETTPNAMMTIWYDSQVTTKAQVENTQQKIAEFPKSEGAEPKLKDIRQIAIVSQNPDIFSDKMGLYFRIDLLKLIITHHLLTANHYNASIVTDIGIDPINEEQLFNQEYTSALNSKGVLVMNSENGFIQAINSHAAIKSLALIINANLQRCWQGLHCKHSELRKFLLNNLFRAVYYDTISTLHFFSNGFKNGTIYIRDNDGGDWAEYDPEIQGHRPLGTYYLMWGFNYEFKEIDIDASDAQSYIEEFSSKGVCSFENFKYCGKLEAQFLGKVYYTPNREISMYNYLQKSSLYRGAREDITKRGRDHNDQISDDFVITEPSLTLLDYKANLAHRHVKPISINHRLQLFGKKEHLVNQQESEIEALASLSQ